MYFIPFEKHECKILDLIHFYFFTTAAWEQNEYIPEKVKKERDLLNIIPLSYSPALACYKFTAPIKIRGKSSLEKKL